MSPRLPRVTFVIDDLGHGGAQRQLSLIAAALAGRVEVHVVSLSSSIDPYARRLASGGVSVTVLPRRSGLEPARLWALVRSLRASRPDVVHGVLGASNAYAFIAARVLRTPVVLSLRSDRLDVTGLRVRVLRGMLRRADAVTVNSRAGHRYLTANVGVPEARLVLVPNIVAVDAPASHSPSPVVGCVGRLVALKRFDAVIDAMAMVRERVPSARLVLVGDGPCRARLQASARALGDAVEFAGAVDDAAPRMAGFACLVVASVHEGIPNAALEALALGVPVAAVPAGDLPDVVVEGLTGVIARDGSPAALADAITRVLTDGSLRDSARREGPRMIRERFSLDRTRDLLADLYHRLGTKTGAVTRM
jgi:glycosyltransferase involved in cell wall biosynthesis